MTTKTGHRPRFYARPSAMDPDNSVDVFQYDRLNEFSEPYCVAVAVTPEEGEAIVTRKAVLEEMEA